MPVYNTITGAGTPPPPDDGSYEVVNIIADPPPPENTLPDDGVDFGSPGGEGGGVSTSSGGGGTTTTTTTTETTNTNTNNDPPPPEEPNLLEKGIIKAFDFIDANYSEIKKGAKWADDTAIITNFEKVANLGERIGTALIPIIGPDPKIDPPK